METVYFAKVFEDAKIPTKRTEDAGYDIYACFKEDFMCIPAHTTKMIPTGIASAFTDDYVMVLKERGSTGTKGMGQRSGIIDSGFRGQWICTITNHNDYDMVIYKECAKDTYENSINILKYPYEKAICQALLLPLPKVEISEITYEELNNFKSERMSGKLGSSNK